MTWIAWDIETCPLPPADLPESHRERLDTEMDYRRDKEPELTEEEVRRKSSSLHPFLGWICCISVARGTPENAPREPHSWTAAAPADEEDLLRQFWSDVANVASRRSNIRWISCGGKTFDAPFVSARSARHGIAPSTDGLLNTHRYRKTPHTDLTNIWQGPYYGLEGLCDHLGVDSPKANGFDGSDVAGAVERGEIDRVRRYCERDAVATLRCAQEIQELL